MALANAMRSDERVAWIGHRLVRLEDADGNVSLPAGAQRQMGQRERVKPWQIAKRLAARLVLWEDGEPISEADDPASILAILRDIERELIAIGGYVDP